MLESRFYWRFNNYVALYELQEFKNCEKPQNKHHKKRHKNVTQCFILNGKELPIYHSTIADVFRDFFVMFICDLLRSYIFVGAICSYKSDSNKWYRLPWHPQCIIQYKFMNVFSINCHFRVNLK